MLQARRPRSVCATTWEERALPSICSCCHRRVVARSRGTESFSFDAAQHEAPPSRWPERRPPLLASRTAYGCCQCQAHPAGRRRHGCGRPNPCGLSALAALACVPVSDWALRICSRVAGPRFAALPHSRRGSFSAMARIALPDLAVHLARHHLAESIPLRLVS